MTIQTTTLPAKLALSTLAGLTLVTALAGCSTTTATPTAATSEAPTVTNSPSVAPSTSTATATAGSTYKDGSYTEDGSYQSPAGTASITVKLTLVSDVVTAVTVTGHGSDPTGKEYQQEFISGIQGQVVGKKISALNVTKVSGSSLTSTGFRAAVTKIENGARV